MAMEKALSLCIFAEKARREDFDLIKERGFACLELPSRFVLLTPERRAEVGGWIAAAGLSVYSGHAPFGGTFDISSPQESDRREAVKVVLSALDALAFMGGEILVVHAGPGVPEPEARPARIENARESLARISEACDKRGVRLAVEILPRDGLGNDVAEMHSLLEGLDPARAGVCLDTNHVNLKSSISSSIEALDGTLLSLHVSDNDGAIERHWCPYKGVIDWAEFAASIRASSYSGPITYEVVASGDGIETDLDAICAAHDRMWA